jgi:hypothetical protein
MNVPMHRFKYTQLTKKQIGQKLEVTESGPKCMSEFSDTLAGKSYKIVTKDGPVLNYTFKSKNKLILSENGAPKVKAGYGALTLKQMVFFSHMIPKTQKGYNVFIDLDTKLVTVFEVWLSSGRKEKTVIEETELIVPDREVQRQIYFGYIEVKGQEPPKERHHHTNRIEGKGLYWKQDTGIETLEFYASVVTSNFIELTRHADNLSYCSPSDYVLINDNMFIYDRTECEFSGIFTLFVADLFTETQVGVRFGFNEKDELEYYMFRGTGKVLGQLARLEPFDEHGDIPLLAQAGPNLQTPGKGERLTYRPIRDFPHMSDEEMHQAALKETKLFQNVADSQLGTKVQYNMPFTDMLVGKEFTLRYDNGGPVRHYKVNEKFKLKYKEEGEAQWHEEEYRAYEGDEKLIFFSHLLTGSKPRASVQVAIDFINGLTTCIHSRMGTKYFGNETTYYAIFGVVEMEGLNPPQYVRHKFTDELVGQAFSWTYSDTSTALHLYTAHSMAWTIFTEDQTMGMQWCAPAIFVKIRDGVYIMAVNEEACNGHEMVVMINRKISHDFGFGFSGSPEGLVLKLIGAIGRHIGQFDIKEYFGPGVSRKGV